MNQWGIHTERLEVRISKDLRKTLEKLAKNNNASMNEVVREGIILLLEKEGRYGKKSVK